MSDLPHVELPKIFALGGGCRLFLVRSGPGAKSKIERETGAPALTLSQAADATVTPITRWTQQRVAVGVEPYLTGLNKFEKPSLRVVPKPVVFHDGALKSMASYNLFVEQTPIPFVDGMTDAPAEADADFFWSKINRTNPQVLETFVVFCGMDTIARVLSYAGHAGRAICGAGAIVPVVLPVAAPPIVVVGMGPNDRNWLHWGNITKEEEAAQQRPLRSPLEASARNTAPVKPAELK